MKFTKIATAEQIDQKWILIDAEGKTFGRMMTEVATLLRGKRKVCWTPNIDCGDYVVIINASRLNLMVLVKLTIKSISLILVTSVLLRVLK